MNVTGFMSHHNLDPFISGGSHLREIHGRVIICQPHAPSASLCTEKYPLGLVILGASAFSATVWYGLLALLL
ncbi:hypothetical protein MMA231_04118 (plasmid) [Asticcacaulis sp. MM231]|uniref:hypothetical protein n=1 Tax=Asticcacaulis sp. MM231 TaxID=3157666 RepID=UPI0032D58C93